MERTIVSIVLLVSNYEEPSIQFFTKCAKMPQFYQQVTKKKLFENSKISKSINNSKKVKIFRKLHHV